MSCHLSGFVILRAEWIGVLRVDHAVQGAVGRGDGFHPFRYLRHVIQVKGLCGMSGAVEGGERLLQAFLVAAGADDRCAQAAEEEGDGLADPGGGAGDEDAFAGEIHGIVWWLVHRSDRSTKSITGQQNSNPRI